MDEHLQNFRAWYVSVLQSLYPIRDTGLATMLVSFPLLERYLRQKNRRTPSDKLNPQCMETLRQIFSVLPDAATATKFWSVYRNGLLHRATLSLRTEGGRVLPDSLTHDISVPVQIEPDGSFVVHPKLFSEIVVRTIEADFQTFAGTGSPGHGLPKVVQTFPLPQGVVPTTTVLHTKGS
jgi:hypothetical protein